MQCFQHVCCEALPQAHEIIFGIGLFLDILFLESLFVGVSIFGKSHYCLIWSLDILKTYYV
jgi:hypothetical protein